MRQPSCAFARRPILTFLLAGLFCTLSAQTAETLWDDLEQQGENPVPTTPLTDTTSVIENEKKADTSALLITDSLALLATADSLPPQEKKAAGSSVTLDSTLAKHESTTTKTLASDSTDATIPENTNGKEVDAEKIAEASTDTTSIAERDRAAAKRLELLGPVKISQVAGVTGLESYRSPRKALFLSLLLPGLGQLYTGGSTGTNLRGALYLTVEAALIIGWWKLGISAYDDKIDEARAWSRDHFSSVDYETRLRTLYKDAVNADAAADFKSTNLSHRERWCQSLYSSNDERARTVCSAPGNKEFDNHIANLAAQGFSPYDRNGYELLLETGDLLIGWEDTRTLPIDFTTTFASIVSPQQERYRSLRDDANRAAEIQTLFIGGIILNHIISAVDAALTAHFYNQHLYERTASSTPRLRLYGGSAFDGTRFESQITAAVQF